MYLPDFGLCLQLLVSCLFEGRFAGQNHPFHLGFFFFKHRKLTIFSFKKATGDSGVCLLHESLIRVLGPEAVYWFAVIFSSASGV